MIVKRTIIAKIDQDTGLAVKQIETTNGTFLNRRIAVNNGFFAAEKHRLLFGKPLLDCFVQTKHIHFDKRRQAWRLSLVNDTIEEAMQHAENNRRILFTYLQMTSDQWDELDWNKAENMFLKLARRGIAIVPYPVPMTATKEEWETKKKEALKVLNKSQELMAVLCLHHEPEKYLSIMELEFNESKFLGIHYFSIAHPYVQANLNALLEITSRKIVGSEVPLVVGFCMPAYLSQYSDASSAYILSLFGVDVISYRVLSPEQVAMLEENPPEEYKFYDSAEGGYNDSSTQVNWYGRELTRTQLEMISANEGLEPYAAHRWANHLHESVDLDTLNAAIISGRVREIIAQKSRWDVALQRLFQRDR